MSTPSYAPKFNVSLRGLNTFGMNASAEALVEINSADQIALLLEDQALPKPIHILGGGSNVLLKGDVKGTVLLNRIGGISIVNEDGEAVWLMAGAGVVWHDLVLYAIGNGWGGIENLALIPGTVGASPIQNIGAYGVEVKDTISEVEVWDLVDGRPATFDNASCRFGYRNSIFKTELKGRIIVTSVTFRLSKQPTLHTEYGAIQDELAAIGVEPSVQSIAQAVINIRRSKLPDPAVIGNAGSFFKNPTISSESFTALKERYPDIPSYPAGTGLVKVPAGWLIEYCGWKGKREGDAGVHAKQALVLVNYGAASGDEIWALSEAILNSVKEAFAIELEREVQVW